MIYWLSIPLQLESNDLVASPHRARSRPRTNRSQEPYWGIEGIIDLLAHGQTARGRVAIFLLIQIPVPQAIYVPSPARQASRE